MARFPTTSPLGWFESQEMLKQGRIVAEIDLRDFWLRMAGALSFSIGCWFGGFQNLAIAFFTVNLLLSVALRACAFRILKTDHPAPRGILVAHYTLCFLMAAIYIAAPLQLASSESWLVLTFGMTWFTGVLMHMAMNNSATRTYFLVQMLPTMFGFIVYAVLLVMHPNNVSEPMLAVTFLIGCVAFVYSAFDLLLRRKSILDELAEARREVEARLAETQQRARTDMLTGLPNRSAFEEILTARLNGPDADRLAVGLLDLNGFKCVNDSFGHDAGDAVLKSVAQVIQTTLGDDGIVARLGGDEFALIFFDCPTRAQALQLGGAIVEASSQPVSFNANTLVVGASLGVVMLTDEEKKSVSSMLRAADLAMYAAKGDSEHVVIYDPAKLAPCSRYGDAARIERALQNDEIVPLYEPKLDLLTNRVVGLEVVSHWRDPAQERLASLAMLKTGLEPDLRCRLDRAAIERCLDDALAVWPKALRTEPLTLSIAITLHSSNNDPTLIEHAIAALRRLDIALMVEIPEEELLSRSVVHKLSQIKAMGAQIAVSEFGVGFASHRHLETAPLDQIKIHRALVADIPHDDRARRILDGHLAMAERLEVDVVADGLETEAQRGALNQLGCRIAQGPLFGAPQSFQAMSGSFATTTIDGVSGVA